MLRCLASHLLRPVNTPGGGVRLSRQQDREALRPRNLTAGRLHQHRGGASFLTELPQQGGVLAVVGAEDTMRDLQPGEASAVVSPRGRLP